jgi:hypothetical protein
MPNTETVKGFHDYTSDDLKQNLTAGLYHLKINTAESGHWDDGRPNLTARTVVASGENAGKFGPMKTWSLGDSDGTRADGTAFHIDGQDELKKLIRDITAIMDGEELVLSDHSVYDEVMLAEIARQIKGREFIAPVKEDKNGYDRAGKISAVSEPPKGFVSSEVQQEFTLDD